MYYKGYVFKQELNHFLIDDLGQKLRSFANTHVLPKHKGGVVYPETLQEIIFVHVCRNNKTVLLITLRERERTINSSTH